MGVINSKKALASSNLGSKQVIQNILVGIQQERLYKIFIGAFFASMAVADHQFGQALLSALSGLKFMPSSA